MSHLPAVNSQNTLRSSIPLITSSNILKFSTNTLLTRKAFFVTSFVVGALALYLLHRWSKNQQPLSGSPSFKPITTNPRDEVDFEKRIKAEYEELSTAHPMNPPSFTNGFAKEALKPENDQHNAYEAVVPYETNRVKLPFYFNASGMYKTFIGKPFQIIASQGPLQNQHTRFWHMALETQAPVIVTLSLPKDKSTYWPTELDQTLTFEENGLDPVTVMLTEEETTDSNITLRKFRVKKGTESPRTVTQLQILDWPDHTRNLAGVASGGVIPKERLVRAIELLNDHLSTLKDGCVITHCVAGVGRTGTFLTALEALARIKYSLTPPYKDLIKDIAIEGRSKQNGRTGLIQTADQYLLVYDAVMTLCPEMKALLKD